MSELIRRIDLFSLWRHLRVADTLDIRGRIRIATQHARLVTELAPRNYRGNVDHIQNTSPDSKRHPFRNIAHKPLLRSL